MVMLHNKSSEGKPMMTQKLPKIEKVGFTLKPDAPEIKGLYQQIKGQFESRGIEVLLSKESGLMIGEEGFDFDAMCEVCDFLVSLGGDGTLLGLVRNSYHYRKPVLGINAGNLGFLADVKIDEVEQFLDNLIIGEYRIDDRMMIEGYIQSNGERIQLYAFNDVVITRPSISKMVKIDASIDGNWFNTYRGDGLIISTPTGSTAYSLASGGPIVYPLTKACILTPISAHSLTQRPLVIPADFTIELQSPDEKVVVIIDGQDHYEMHSSDLLILTGASVGARLLHRKERNYFSVLREKLSWGDKS